MPGRLLRPTDAVHRLLDRLLAGASVVSPSVARYTGLRLVQLDRHAEAEALLAAAAARFPRHAGLAARRAFVAEHTGDPQAALEKWRAACAFDPHRVASWRGFATFARTHGDVASAASAIAEALARRPNDWRTRFEAALVAEAAGDLEAARRHWSHLVARRRVDPRWRQGLTTILLKQDKIDEAQSILDAARRRHPDHRGLLFVEGQLALRREAWDKAFAIFSALADSRPDDGDARAHVERVATIQRLVAAEAHGQPPQMRAPIDVERIDDEAVRQLMLRFEGIGADCEFGTVQRRFGAEPLGLLRWNDVAYPNLIAALEARFDGLGEPPFTELLAGEIGEFYMRDRRWDLGMHTFLFEGEISRETLLPKMQRRVAFLRDKFLADLSAAEKIFVFKADDLTAEELAHLHASLKRFGPVRLLHVRHVASAGTGRWPPAAAGEVATLAPDLMVGYVSRMGDLYDPPYDEWVEICRSASAAPA